MDTSMEKKADGGAAAPQAQGLKSWVDAISSWAKEHPETLTNMLAAGGAGAIGGGLLTEGDPEDTTADRIRKKLINALLIGGTAAGAVGLGSYGADKLVNTPDPAERSMAEHIKDVVGVPGVERPADGISSLLYGGTGLLGAGAGYHMDSKHLNKHVKNLAAEVAGIRDSAGNRMYNIVPSTSASKNIENLSMRNANGKLAEALANASNGGSSVDSYAKLLKSLGVGVGKPHVRKLGPGARTAAGAAIGVGIPALASGLLSLVDNQN